MDITNAQKPVWANAEKTLIDLEIDHPVFGSIQFTASPEDVEAHGRELFARATAGDFGPVADYIAPAPQETPEPTEGDGEPQ